MPTIIKNPTTGRTPGMLETQVDLNNCREDSNIRESSCIRDFSEKTTE
jgi:hypothetical protein